MYKITDFLEDILRRLKDIKDNHLFLLFFVSFIVFAGTCGIWLEPIVLSSQIDWSAFPDSFNTLALISFCAPLLSVTIFDSVVKGVTKLVDDRNKADVPLMIWFSILTIVFLLVVIFLFAMGAKSGDAYSAWSSSAWLLVLMYWAVANIDNPAYKKISETSSPSGDDQYDHLLRGK
ncbi:MAG: hypothetical protein ABW087_00300 [Candidatus Thiodiazotropha sp.]